MISMIIAVLTFTLFLAQPLCAKVFALGDSAVPVKITIQGQSMEPLLKDGATIAAIPFDCEKNPNAPRPARGDIVVFNSGASPEIPLIKRVAALTGDILLVRKDGRVIVNGKPALNPSEKPYIASSKGKRMIGLYAGKIPDNAYLVLARPGTFDSGRFGLISCEQIIGVVKR